MTDALLKVYGPDLTTLIATLDQPYGIAWSHERLGVGAGQFTLPHDSPVLQANPTLLRRDNRVTVEHGTDRFSWMIRRRQRTRGDVWDPIQVTGPGATILLDQALVYMPNGLAGVPADYRKFAWMAIDYRLRDGWGDPTSLGTYADPTDSSLIGAEGDPGTNEIQQVVLNADSPPFPWGSSYPSPGGLGGTWGLVHEGQTATFDWDDNAATVEAGLDTLSTTNGVTVTGSGTTADPFVVEFTDARAHDLMTLLHDDLRHTHNGHGVTRTQGGSQAVEAEGLVDGWPDDRAEWFGNYGFRQHTRRVLDVEASPSAAGDVIIAVVSLGEVDVWLDGDHLGAGKELDLLEFTATLFPTQHVLAFRADAPTMVTVIEDLGGGEYGSVLYRSFTPAVFGGPGSPDPWFTYGPDTPPGETPGFILATLFDDAQDRGYLPPLTRDFTHDADSEGKEWPTETELGLQVGDDTVLSAGDRLRDIGVTIDVTPGLVFQAWGAVRVDRGATPDSGVSTVIVGLDRASQVSIEAEDEYLNSLLIRTEDTWLEQHVATGDGRREGFVSLGQIPSAQAGSDLALILLDDLIDPRVVLAWALHSDQGAPQPEADYAIGDVIVGPRLSSALLTGDWTTGDVVVDTLAGQVDITGGVLWVHETSLA